jgi:Tfp pilus assembly protein PilZ
MKERRKEPRKPLMAYTQVFDLYGGRLVGLLGDLTIRGIMVIGDKPIDTGSSITLAIELPELPEIKASRIIFPSRVAWCEQDISPTYFNIGFEFLEVKPEQVRIIETIIKNYEF